jgi:uncharacterized protein YkwD
MTFMEPSSFITLSQFASPLTVDLLFFVALVIYVLDEARMGIIIACMNVMSLILGYLLAVLLYASFSPLFVRLFSLTPSFADLAAFLSLAFIISFIARLGLIYAQRLYKNIAIPRVVHYGGGALCGFAAFFFLSLILINVFLSFPIAEGLRQAILRSHSGKFLLSYSFIVEHDIKAVFGQAIADSLHFMTVKPAPNESVQLHFKVEKVVVDQQAEKEMVRLLNSQRMLQGLNALSSSATLTYASRAHATDMARRGYFSHYSPEGLSPFDRLAKRSISYSYAGENLALAPNVEIAMQGLMKSPGHRANILSPHFGQVGVGVIDMGIYGKMYVQTFSN